MDPKDITTAGGVQAKGADGANNKDVGKKKPGKVSGTDNYGQGGNAADVAVPGKKSGTEHLPAGPNSEGYGKGKKNADKSDRGPNVSATPPAPAKDAGGPPTADADAKKKKAAKGGPKKGGKGDAAGGAKKQQTNHAVALAPTNGANAQPMPLQMQAFTPPKLAVIPTVPDAEPVVVPAAIGKADASLETLRTEVASLSTLIKSNRDDILAYSKALQTQVNASLEGHAAHIDALTNSGSARVRKAYDDLSGGINKAALAASIEIGKREKSIPAAIKSARDKKSAEITAHVDKTKAAARQAITQGPGVQAANKTASAFATDIDKKKLQLVEGINKLVATHSGELNPKKYTDQVKYAKDHAAKQIGLEALWEDKQLSVLTGAGKAAVKEIEAALAPYAESYRGNGLKIIDEALKDADEDLQILLEAKKPDQEKSLDAAADTATKTLQTQVDNTRTGLDTATKAAEKRVATERTAAQDGAQRAGKQLSENIKAGAKEIGNAIEKKATQDAASYNDAMQTLRSLGNSKKLDPKTKAKLDELRTQLTTAHAANRKTLEEMATKGVAQMKSDKEQQYLDAITGYEAAAGKTKTELVNAMNGGSTDLAKAFDGIGTSFDKTVTAETKKLDGALKGYAKMTASIPDGLASELQTKLTVVTTSLDGRIKEILNPETLKADIKAKAKPEAEKYKKTAESNVKSLYDAMDGAGTGENTIFRVLRSATPGEIVCIEGFYGDEHANYATSDYPSPLRAHLDDELSGGEWDIAFAYLNHEREKALKMELDDSRGVFNDEEDRIEEVLRAASDEELKNIMASPDGKEAIRKVKDCLSGCDLDVVKALTETDENGIPVATRKVKASAIRIYDVTVDKCGTDEDRVKKILEEAGTEQERQQLREFYNVYYAQRQRPWKPLSKEEEEAAKSANHLENTIDNEMSGGEWTVTRSLAKVKRDEFEIKMAKLVEGAEGGGTDEDKMFDMLDDEKYAEEYKNASPERQKEMAAKREKKMNDSLQSMTDQGIMTRRFKGDSVTDIIEGEMGTSPVTYAELIKNEWGPKEKRGDKAGKPINMSHFQKRMLNLEYMVAQRKLESGQAEPELLLAYACWGVDGTDESLIKKVLTKEGSAWQRDELETLKGTFERMWGVALASAGSELTTKKEPGGLLANELDGRDWCETRILLMGKPETPTEIGYVDNVRYAFVNDGNGSCSPFSNTKRDMEFAHKRLQDEVEVAEKDNKTLASYNPEGPKEDTIDDNRLETLANYSERSEWAFLEAKEAVANAVITVVELIGAALITAASMGASSPLLVAFIGNLILSGVTIQMRRDMLGSAYGGESIGIDVVKGFVTAGLAAAGEAKYLAGIAKTAGARAGKMYGAFREGVEAGGMKLADDGIAVGAKGAQRLESAVTAGVKNVHNQAAGQIADFVLDENTYKMKLFEALFGENSLGRRLLMTVPQAFVQGAVSDYIQNIAGVASIDHPPKGLSGPKQVFYNTVADVMGNTAGFFVYLDNYEDAGNFWMELFKSNAKSVASGALTGYAMHKRRAAKLGRDVIVAKDDPAELQGAISRVQDAVGYMEPHELKKIADMVATEKPEMLPLLPQAVRDLASAKAGAKTNGANQTTPTQTTSTATATTPTTNTSTNEPSTTSTDPTPVTAKNNNDDPDARKRSDEERKRSQQDDQKKKAEDERLKREADDRRKHDEDQRRLEDERMAAEKKKQQDAAHDQREEDQRRAKQEADEQLESELEQFDEDRRWSDSDDDLALAGGEENRDGKRRDKRRQKEDSEEDRRQQRDEWEADREQHREGDAKRRDKKERRRADKKRQGELLDLATQAHAEYAPKIEDAKTLLKDIVGDLGEVQGRAKDPESAANRLKRAEDNFGAKITDAQSAKDNIWDALGTRVVVSGNQAEIDQVLQKLAAAIQAGDIKLVQGASNHGDGVMPYLDQAALDMLNAASGGKAKTADGVKKADADKSAFTSGLLFVQYKDGTRGEIQIIGKKVLEVAAIEHIPYDLSIGKPLARGLDERFMVGMKGITDPVEAAYKAIQQDPVKKAAYEAYMRDLYQHARNLELGIESQPPKFPDGMDKVLSADGLKKVYDEIEALKAQAKKTQTGSTLAGAVPGSESDGAEIERTNKTAMQERSKAALEKLPADQQNRAKAMLAEASTETRKAMLERAIAAGRNADELDQLRAFMSDLKDDEIARTLTGAGVVQFFEHSCVPTAFQIALADLDPYFAFQLRRFPEKYMDQQREKLETNEGPIQKRRDVRRGKDPDGMNSDVNIKKHLEDPEMAKKLHDDASYSGKNADKGGIEMPDMRGDELHKELERVTGHKYEFLANETLDFKKASDGTFGEKQVPLDRIMAAVDAQLPVIMGQHMGFGHAVTIVGYSVDGDGPDRKITFKARDPKSGKLWNISDTQMKLFLVQGIAVPVLAAQPKTTASDSEPKKQIVKNDDPNLTKTGAVIHATDDDATRAEDTKKTRTDDGHQTEKPEAETFADAHSRRSQPPKATRSDGEDWATSADRKKVPETVPLTRQELRDIVVAKYGETLKPFLDNKVNTQSPELKALIAKIAAEEPGFAAKDKAGSERMKQYWADYQRITKETAGRSMHETGVDEGPLRTMYNIVEKMDMKTDWLPAVAHLPLEQQAKLAHMWREEWKIFVRDMMVNNDEKEFLYLRDRAIYGDRRGRRFEEFVDLNKKETGGDENEAMKMIIDSSTRSNKDVNKAKTKNEDGLDPELVGPILAKAKNPADELPKVRAENEQNLKASEEAIGTRRREIHLGDDTPYEPPTAQEKGLRGELDQLWKLRQQRDRNIDKLSDIELAQKSREISELQSTIDAKLADPTFKDQFLDPHVVFALSREASSAERSPALHDFIRQNIEAFRKSQDQARQGADPQLRAKREVFERELAKAVLSGSLKQGVDDNLAAMCKKALDYISKLPEGRQDEALASLGVKASGGYAGAVLTSDSVYLNARTMEKVLLEGNVRERMIALGKFAELVASDLHKDNGAAFDAVAAQSSGKAGEFGVAEAQAYRERMEKHRAQVKPELLQPGKEKDFLGSFLKPLKADTKEGESQHAYQTAKSQDMDAKIPSVSTTLQKTSETDFPAVGDTLPENKKTPGMTGSGEASTLARTKITIEEAQTMGYELSPREIEAAKANGGVLPWVVGTIANVVDPQAAFIQEGSKNSLPQKAGISGTTYRFMEAAMLLGGDPEKSRLAMLGALQVIDAHTVYEIASAANGFMDQKFDPKNPYLSLGLPRELLEEIAVRSGTSLAELNGETKTSEPQK